MAPGQNIFTQDGQIPRPNVQALAESLRTGRLDMATLLAQVNSFVCETLKVVEEFADEQNKLHHEQRVKADRMDKVINDLSEKCQGMQQALLYKEEKYDEKCREAERYKVICELSAKAAVDDGAFYTPDDDLNNNINNNSNNNITITDRFNDAGERRDRKDNTVKTEGQDLVGANLNLRSHVKLSQSQLKSKQFAEPMRADSPRSSYEDLRPINQDDDGRRSVMTQYYAGGPCRRKIPLVNPSNLTKSVDSRIRERMEDIGGINVRGSYTGPVAAERLKYASHNPLYNQDINKRVKIDLTSQRNEMMSSSGDVAHQMKQKYVEKDLHRQVAGGCWTRLASRRKKDWPF